MSASLTSNWSSCTKCSNAVWIPDGQCPQCGQLLTDAAPAPGTETAAPPKRRREPWYVGLVIAGIATLVFSALGASGHANEFGTMVLGCSLYALPFLLGYYLRHWIKWVLSLGTIALGVALMVVTFNSTSSSDDGWGVLFAILIAAFVIVVGVLMVVGGIAGSVVARIVARRQRPSNASGQLALSY